MVSLKQRGFTLLEAIVALVLIATTGMALFGWLNTNLLSLNRVQQAQQRQQAIRNALDMIATINPMLRPTGAITLSPYTFQWQATPVESPKEGLNPLYANLSYYRVGLYQLDVSVLSEQMLVAQFSVRQMGYEQVRRPSFEDDF